MRNCTAHSLLTSLKFVSCTIGSRKRDLKGWSGI